MAKSLIFICIFVINILEITSFPKEEYHSPKGRSWEYGTKIVHPAPKHGYHHKGNDYHSEKDLGKGWTNTYDSGEKHYDKHYDGGHEINIPLKHQIPIRHDTPIYIPPVHSIPIHIPKYESELGHDYSPKPYPIQKHIIHYEPKKYEEEKKDSLDINIDGIIDDIQKDLKKTTNYVS